ncbi:hypothetical protein [Methylacidiphilum caldifontis]|uniref:Uncharacterized protein n=1 Tax=Methylacidiphilum caldifontis TaxID=2795386 RepID=A0A4Y8P7H3_9BACT|nr:hypothetical protein [Methylacidiphilum caldifontis]TFE66282.1 hypothetical protein A7Q10_10235 [Methylacidiphilum caldifontis]
MTAWKILMGSTVLGAALLAATMSTPAFAAQGDHDSSNSRGESIKIDYVNESPAPGGGYTVTVKLSQVPDSAQWIVFRQVTTPASLTANDDAGTVVGQVQPSLKGSQTTVTFFRATPLNTGYLVAEADKNQNPTQEPDRNAPLEEVGQESDPVNLDPLPYGQLPEVPWAAGLPVILLAAGGWYVWRQRQAPVL